ncbi:MAG: twin-arginine translocase subunit TatC [Bacteroidota bacterium]
MDLTDEIPEESNETEKEMSFLDHLEELRWCIIYSLLGLLIGTIISFVFIDFLVDKILLLPARNAGLKLQNLKPFGQIFLYFEIALIAGLVVSLPNFIYQIWRFISPALRKNERRYIVWIVFYTTLCFLSGIVFAYYVMLPMSLSFAVQFGSAAIENNFAVEEYFSIIISVMLAAGIVFELPMVSFFLSKIGLLTPGLMRKFRRHAIVVIMIVAAVLTPGTDPVSQIILAIPLVLLYEISIFVSKISQRKIV